jgi:ion channel-forming bestrophin family protein
MLEVFLLIAENATIALTKKSILSHSVNMLSSKQNIDFKREKRGWFRLVFQLRGSVIVAILPRILTCAAFGFLISLLYSWGYPVHLSVLSGLVPAIVLGLLLVFRTNTAYERFWEGRKCWGAIVNTSNNVAAQIWVVVKEVNPEDREEKKAIARLVVAFAIATKLHLRMEPLNNDLARFLTPQQYDTLQKMNNPPLQIIFLMRDYFQEKYEQNCLNSYQLTAIFKLLDILVDSLGACERILKTPVPLAYSIHLKQLLLIYCLALPFQMVKDLGWWTAPVAALVSFAVFGIEEIGIEIENPFGYDPNDLPLDTICRNLERNIEDLLLLTSEGIKGATL